VRQGDLVYGFEPDQSCNASNVCEAQEQKDRCLRTQVHLQAADDECGKDAVGPVSDRRHYRMGIGEAFIDLKVDAMTLGWITCDRPEEADRLTLNKDLDQKCDAEKAGENHDRPDHPAMPRFDG